MGVLDERIRLMRGATPFMRVGNLPLLLLCLLQVALVWRVPPVLQSKAS